MNRSEFKIGDTVQVGLNGQKGKVTDIIHPLGTFCMYKVRLFTNGNILTVARHELVKGLGDELFKFNVHNKVGEKHTFTASSFVEEHSPVTETTCEGSFLDTLSSEELAQVLECVGPCTDSTSTMSTDTTSPPNQSGQGPPVQKEQPHLSVSTNPVTQAVNQSNVNRFAVPVEIDSYIAANENEQTRKKTLGHQKLLEAYLQQQNESRPIHEIPPEELNDHLCQFMVAVRQKNGQEYEPVTLRSMLSSFERYLKRHNYKLSLINSHEFAKLREVLKYKQRDLKKQGYGNNPMVADAINDDEVEMLYEAGQLGASTPSSLINTLWLNNTLHFGMRGGASEHRQLCWGDLKLCFDNDANREYIEYNERQTKTRTGEDTSNTRKSKPRMYATNDKLKCPVMIYKKYASKRPEKMQKDDSPFYIAPVTHTQCPSEKQQWFLSQPIGVNKIKTVLKSMAEKAQLPDLPFKRLTNTSVRKYLCQKLLENNVPDTQAVHITGHKHPDSLNRYRKLSNRQQHHMSTMLSSTRNENVPDVATLQTPSPMLPPVTTTNVPIHHTMTHSQELDTGNMFSPSPMLPPVTTTNVPIHHTMTHSQELDTGNMFRSIFNNSNIHGGTFNITMNMTPDQPAKRPRLEE